MQSLMLGLTFNWVPGWKNKSVKVRGACDPAYEKVKDEFQRFYDEGYETKSQLCIYVGEECVVDLYGDQVGGYSPDKIQTIWSSGKSVAAILMGMAQSRGHFEWTDPVIKYWTEFGQNGKEHIRIVDVMRHEAGLALFTEKVDLAQCNTKGVKEGYLSKVFEKMRPYCKT